MSTGQENTIKVIMMRMECDLCSLSPNNKFGQFHFHCVGFGLALKWRKNQDSCSWQCILSFGFCLLAVPEIILTIWW